MRARKVLLSAGLVTLGVASLFAFPGPGTGADRGGYFKSADGDRVLAYSVAAPVTEAEARAIFDRSPSTPGRITVAVVYGPGVPAPGDRLTTAPDLPAALRLVGEDFPDWSWRVRRNPAGVVTVDRGE